MTLKSKKELGSGAVGVAGLMLGFSLVYFIFYFVVNWIYDTKEERKLGYRKNNEELRVITKEEVMKRGIGQHVFVCFGLFSKTCREWEVYMDTVDS